MGNKRSHNMGNTLDCTASWRRAQRAGMMPCSALFLCSIFGGPDISPLVFVQLSDQYWPEVNTPHPRSHWLESDIVPHKGFTHKAPFASPANFAITFDPTPYPSFGITPWLYLPGQSPPALFVSCSRNIHTDAFMRALLVIIAQPPIAPPLLFCPPFGWALGYLGFINSVKLLMCSVLTRPPRSRKFHLNAQLDPPRA